MVTHRTGSHELHPDPPGPGSRPPARRARADARSLRTLAALAAAAHPGPCIVVTGLAAGLAVAAGAGAPTTALIAAAVLTGQLSVGWSNDWLDAERDRRVGRATKPVVTGRVDAATLRRAALAALAVCIPASLGTGLGPGAVHLAAVGGAWAYNVRLKATVWSWLPFAFSFGLLPVFVQLAAGAAVAPWSALAAALLGSGAHVANTLPDFDDDAATGIAGLPHRLGRRRSAVLAPTLLAAACVILVIAPAGPPAAPVALLAFGAIGLAVAAGVAGVTRPTSRAPFALSMAVALLCCAGLLISA